MLVVKKEYIQILLFLKKIIYQVISWSFIFLEIKFIHYLY